VRDDPREASEPRHARARATTRRGRALIVLGLILAIVAAIAVTVVNRSATAPEHLWATPKRHSEHGTASANSGSQASSHPASSRHGKSAPGASPSVAISPRGVRSATIIDENRRSGTRDWVISSTAAPGYIQGFANLNYAQVGQQVTLYVTTTATAFRVVAYRMGYYQGTGARRVWTSALLPGVVQAPCPLTAGVNMISCDNWTPSTTISVTSAFVQGDYLLKLIGTTGVQSYVQLTVWDPHSTATYLVMSRSLTEEGWNDFGGYSFYTGAGGCTLGQKDSYPPCNRARIVSFDRPYAEGNGASDFLQSEDPLIFYMEEYGLDVSYVTDITVNDHPEILLQHRALLSLDHDETWTYSELQGARNALSNGVNVAFFGAAAVVRHARLQPSPLGSDREEVDYRNEAEDPLNGGSDPNDVTGNTWASSPSNWDEASFVGGVYSGYTYPGVSPLPFTVYDDSAWIFKGTALHDGSTVAGVIDSDIDHLDGDSPANIQVLGHSPLPVTDVYTNQGRWNGLTYSDMTYYTDPVSQGGVFDSGTVNWIFSMTPCAHGTSCPALAVDTMTGNLLWLFGQGPSGKLVPPVPNKAGLLPPGS
jgi:hypothetical protein